MVSKPFFFVIGVKEIKSASMGGLKIPKFFLT
jgi:hypothetical protein